MEDTLNTSRDNSFEEKELNDSPMKKLALFVNPNDADRNQELKQVKVELQLAKDQIINLESRCKTLIMENLELKEELGHETSTEVKPFNHGLELNVKA